MSDVDIIRQALTMLHSRLQDEGYAPQSGQPDPELVFEAALLALDRIEAELARSFHLPDEVVDQIRRGLGEKT